MDFNNYIQPNIAARGAVAQEGIIVDIVNKITQFSYYQHHVLLCSVGWTRTESCVGLNLNL